MKKISVSLSGHQTSITLESEFIDALQKLAIRQNRSIAAIINDIDSTRPRDRNLSSAVRVWILQQAILQTYKN
jgi:predicted DNA-binding ribbon-helix-helix protein